MVNKIAKIYDFELPENIDEFLNSIKKDDNIAKKIIKKLEFSQQVYGIKMIFQKWEKSNRGI